MKLLSLFSILALIVVAIYACEKKDYPKGLSEFDHHYYFVYVPNTNDSVKVNRTQTALIKLPVQFYSTFTRDYDAVGYYTVETTGLNSPAALGIDFNIVDKAGNVINPVDGKFSLTFPQAKQAKDTIYVKLLNNQAPGIRRAMVNLVGNITSQYVVDTFSTARKRPLVIQ